MKLFLLAGLLLASSVANAAGDGHGSATDLIPAFTNLFILFGVLFYVLRKPVKNYYVEKSEDIKSVLERASIKAKEAEMMMEAQKKKIDSVADEIDKIYKETDETIVKFKKDYAAQVDHRIVKLKEDAASKIEAEKKEQINKLNSNFLDTVILKAKDHIKGDPSLSSNATDKILEGLRQ